jgi:hypothetical protein
MIPLASASGPAIIGAVVVAAGLFLSWLLRAETSEDPPKDTTGGIEEIGQPTVTSQPSE